MNFVKIDHLKKELDDLGPLPSAAVKNLDEVYRVEWTYNSNAIDGNTLTLLETKLVLEERLTIGGKKLHEHLRLSIIRKLSTTFMMLSFGILN
nr:cell filamentation protein Fic [Paenibacillus alginolyticus]